MKQFGLDEYATLQSPIHQWEVRYKLVGLLALIFAFSFIRDVRLIPLMFALTGGLFLLSRLPLHYLIARLKLPGYFLLALAVLLPLTAGQTILWRFGPFALRLEGLHDLLLIASRFICIITVTLVLFGTAPFITSIKGMRALGLPEILADMILLTYRYLFEVGHYFTAMRTAVRMRGFDSHDLSRRQLTILASLVGSLLVRSYEQSERVYKAMILRGYGFAPPRPDEFRSRPIDKIACGISLMIATAVVSGQLWLNG